MKTLIGLMVALALVAGPGPVVAGEVGPAAAAGLTLSALTPEYLEAIEKATGYRVGVLVAAVAAESPAATAGFRTGDLLYTVGGRPVDSPAAVDAVLAGQAGEVAVTGVRPTAAGGWEPLEAALKLAAKAPEGPAVTRKGHTYRHVIGFTFWYPDGWKVVSAEGSLQLLPVDAAGTPGSPEEIYFITGESIEGTGISSASDPEVARYLDSQVQSMLPAFRRTRGPEAVPTTKGAGALIEWQAKAASGEEVLGRAYVNIIGNHGVALVAIGIRKHLESRDESIRAIFASFGFGEGRLDSAISGSWTLVSTGSLSTATETSDGARGGVVSETQSALELRPDGTFERVDVHEIIAMGAGTTLADKQRTVTRGRWNAGDGVLCLMGEDESFAEYRYEVAQGEKGLELRLAGNGRREVWSR